MKNIAEGEKAASSRALTWLVQRNEWQIPRPMDGPSVLTDPMGDLFHSPRSFPDILQPETMRMAAHIKQDLYRREAQRFDKYIERYYKLPAHEQAEVFFDYPFRKSELDFKRVDLSTARRDLSNAEWLKFRDEKIKELNETNRDFAFYKKGVEEYAQEFISHGREHEKVNDRLRLVRLEKQGLLSELELVKLQLDGKVPKQYPVDVLSKRYNELDAKLLEIDAMENGVLANLQKMTRRFLRLSGESGFTNAHVEASNELAKAGLNKPGLPLAGRLLSAPGIAADVSQIAAIAGVGPMKNYDNTGASYTNDEVVEVGGVKRVRSEVEELSAYHPDNAKNHPEISDLDRIDYFRRRGASKEVMSGLPGYEKWKSEQDSKNKIIINPSSVMFKPFFQ